MQTFETFKLASAIIKSVVYKKKMTFERQSIGHLSAGNLGHLSENENKLRTFQQNKKSPETTERWNSGFKYADIAIEKCLSLYIEHKVYSIF